MDKEFAEKIKKELGEEINPFYVEKLLSMDTPELLLWILGNSQDMEPTIQETIHHYFVQRDSGNEYAAGSFKLGLRILENNFKIVLFVLQEIKSRTEAIETTAKKSL